jgi:hypothetical protein
VCMHDVAYALLSTQLSACAKPSKHRCDACHTQALMLLRESALTVSVLLLLPSEQLLTAAMLTSHALSVTIVRTSTCTLSCALLGMRT